MSNFAYTEKSKLVNPRLTEHSKTMEQKIYKTGENVYSAVGFGLSYPVMIEGTDGIIIIDPGETIEMMEEIMKHFRKITDKPIKAVIISHNHGDHWGGMSVCVSQEQSQNEEVLVIVDETFIKHFSQSSGELLDIRMGRAVWMYGSILPRGEHGYVNLGCGPVLSKGSNKFIEPNTFSSVEDGLKITISGVDLELFHCEAETEDAMCIFLPNEKIMFVGDAIQGEIFPNIYTVRGTVRDAKKWYTGIDKIREYQPHYLVGTHMRPLHGKDECNSLLTDYRDAIQYTHDQAVRLINMGYTPDYAINELGKLPPHLFQRERLGEFYGTFKQGIKAVYDQYIGWFNGEASKLNPIYPKDAAKKYVKIMGGREIILAEAKKAIDEEDYEWAAEILNYPIRINNNDIEARRLKATAIRMLGYQTENATWRNWYLTSAMALDGGFEQIVNQVGANAGFPPFSNSFIGLTSKSIFESFKVKLNGPKSSDVHMTLLACVTDTNETFKLELRRGIVEINNQDSDVKADVSINASKETWAKLITKEITIIQAIENGLVKCDNPKKAQDYLDLFDKFTPFVNMPFWLQ